MENKPKLNKAILLGSLIPFVIGIIFISIGIGAHISDANFRRDAIATTAIITHIDDTDVYVAFEVDGIIHESRLNFYSSNMRTGNRIDIYYNPHNLRQVRTNSSTFLLIFAITGLASLTVSIILISTTLRKHHNNKKLIENGKKIMADIVDIVCGNMQVNNRHGERVICEWLDETSGITYTFRSCVVFNLPRNEEAFKIKLPIYIDRGNIKKYYVDTSPIFKNFVTNF